MIARLKLVASSAFAWASSSSGTITGIRLVKPPNDSGHVIPATSATAGTVQSGALPASRTMPTRLVAASTWSRIIAWRRRRRAVEPGAQQRAGDEARQRDRRDGRAGQRGAARAVQDQQHHADREHLVGEAGDRRRRVEERIAGMAPQPAQVAVGHRLIVSQASSAPGRDATVSECRSDSRWSVFTSTASARGGSSPGELRAPLDSRIAYLDLLLRGRSERARGPPRDRGDTWWRDEAPADACRTARLAVGALRPPLRVSSLRC